MGKFDRSDESHGSDSISYKIIKILQDQFDLIKIQFRSFSTAQILEEIKSFSFGQDGKAVASRDMNNKLIRNLGYLHILDQDSTNEKYIDNQDKILNNLIDTNKNEINFYI